MLNNKKLIYLIIVTIITYILLDQNILISYIDGFIGNALLRNIIIFIIYISILNLICIFNIYKKKMLIYRYFKYIISISLLLAIMLPYNVIYNTNFKQYSKIFNISMFIFTVVLGVIIIIKELYQIELINSV